MNKTRDGFVKRAMEHNFTEGEGIDLFAKISEVDPYEADVSRVRNGLTDMYNRGDPSRLNALKMVAGEGGLDEALRNRVSVELGRPASNPASKFETHVLARYREMADRPKFNEMLAHSTDISALADKVNPVHTLPQPSHSIFDIDLKPLTLNP